jgi:ribonucleotide monophosphatase NagD (HAD superfamily)
VRDKPKTIICDIDGVLLRHNNKGLSGQLKKAYPLPGTLEKLNEWDAKGYNIILITGRRESLRESTEDILRNCAIFYDKLIMGVGGGTRVIINDKKPDSNKNTAAAINLTRNEGIKNIEL